MLIGPLSAEACEGNTLNIKCDNGRITVISANYGRLSKTKCNTDGRKPVKSTNCRSAKSFDIVKDKCNNKRQCSVQATNGIFGDPCDGTYKYLNVKYSCSQQSNIITKVACEGKQLELECPRGEEIKILRANYGRSSTGVCPSLQKEKISNTKCESKQKSKLIVSKTCNDQRQCKVLATNAVFGDPCVNTLKYLEVEFTCEKDRKN